MLNNTTFKDRINNLANKRAKQLAESKARQIESEIKSQYKWYSFMGKLAVVTTVVASLFVIALCIAGVVALFKW